MTITIYCFHEGGILSVSLPASMCLLARLFRKILGVPLSAREYSNVFLFPALELFIQTLVYSFTRWHLHALI